MMSPNAALFDAIDRGDLAAARDAVGRGADLGATNAVGQSPIDESVSLGRNDITSKPILHMLGGRMCNAAAISCHRHVRLEDQKRLIREADILVTAVGAPEYRITADMVKPALATAVNGPQPTPRITVPSSPSIPPPQPVRAAGWDDTAKRWP